MTEQTNAGVKKLYCISLFEVLDLDLLIVPYFHPLLVELGTVVGLLPPFSQLNLPFNSS
jgi:hypothetical protein